MRCEYPGEGDTCLWCGRAAYRRDLNEQHVWIGACRAHLHELHEHVMLTKHHRHEAKAESMAAFYDDQDRRDKNRYRLKNRGFK